MPSEEPVLMSKLAYAKYLGINEKSVRNAIADGKIVKGWDTELKKIRVAEADVEFGHLHKIATVKPGVSKAKRAAKVTEQNQREKQKQNTKKPELKNAGKKNSEKSEPEDDTNEYSFDHSQEFINDTFENFGDTYEELLLKIPVTSDLPYNEAVRRREIIQLAMEKKKLEELQTVLVRRENVEKTLYASAINLKKALMNIPARVADDVLAANNKVEVMNILSEELTAVLTEYANVGQIDLTVKAQR